MSTESQELICTSKRSSLNPVKILYYVVKSLRPKQWTKNLFIFAGLLFSQNLTNYDMLLTTISAFGLFCALSGAVYLLNDLVDIEKDKLHPVKCKRPLASGRLPKSIAVVVMLILVSGSLLGAYIVGLQFFFVSVGYVVLQIAYSLYLKHQVILDVFSIASGFALRIIAGALAINVSMSSWLLICTTMISLFLGFGKRRHELASLQGEAVNHRKVLAHYSAYFLDQMIMIVTAATVVAYVLYTISDETVTKFGTRNLVCTVPFVLYGIFRYLYLIHQKGEGGDPENMIVSDKPLLFTVVLWVLSVGLILYF
ncbi:MAG: decaprenyl-phosphate phosphoribosyltransferase [Deltaproteobacteria bacterium]|jgi:4-hydroxybenzoate polyprenyltransferase|nr:decaprenyl-phosphate phosphoribosyltransferase [Deltaproteobacteria bacterium]